MNLITQLCATRIPDPIANRQRLVAGLVCLTLSGPVIADAWGIAKDEDGDRRRCESVLINNPHADAIERCQPDGNRPGRADQSNTSGIIALLLET